MVVVVQQVQRTQSVCLGLLGRGFWWRGEGNAG